MTLYDIKPRFQSLLRPLVKRLNAAGLTANQITLAAMFGSIAVGVLISIYSDNYKVFMLLPIWMFLRMALNAIDGMLARECQQKSNLGAFLNEISDLISDAALFIPFAFIAPFTPTQICLIIFLALLSEFAGVVAQAIGASRRYDGPMGKSDRALVFGAIALWIGIGGSMPAWLYWLLPVMAVLLGLTIFNRIKRALSELN